MGGNYRPVEAGQFLTDQFARIALRVANDTARRSQRSRKVAYRKPGRFTEQRRGQIEEADWKLLPADVSQRVSFETACSS